MEYNIQDIIEYIVLDLGIGYDKAMLLFYNSQTFDKLMDIETGLYLESSAYVYGLFQDERNFGNLMQAEIQTDMTDLYCIRERKSRIEKAVCMIVGTEALRFFAVERQFDRDETFTI